MRGEGAGWVMPAFAFGGPGRFNRNPIGCFYCAEELETAVAETAYHMRDFFRATGSGQTEVLMRVLRSDISGQMVDVAGLPPSDPKLG